MSESLALVSSLPHDTPVKEQILGIQVVLKEPVPVLTYLVPEFLQAEILEAYAREESLALLVPLGSKRTLGYIASLEYLVPTPAFTLKKIIGVDERYPKLPLGLLKLLAFAATYYGVLPGVLLKTFLPGELKNLANRYRLAKGVGSSTLEELELKERTLLKLFGNEARKKLALAYTANTLAKRLSWPVAQVQALCQQLVKQGYLQIGLALPKEARVAVRYTATSSLRAENNLPPLAEQLLILCREAGQATSGSLTLKELQERLPPSLGAQASLIPHYLKRLTKRGLIKRVLLKKSLQPLPPSTYPLPSLVLPELTLEQAAALETLEKHLAAANGSTTFLLEGVTGSGKTEIYLRLIAKVLAKQQTALVLVPEIALTPQLGARFQQRFGDLVAIFHSGLTPAEKRSEWERVATGKARIGLGARSALFLPLKQLGVIIVDEEHEACFKQQDNPRYQARDLAVFRGKVEQALVVLGSATPSLETYANALKKRYVHLRLTKRVPGRGLPQVELIDLKKAKKIGQGFFTEYFLTQLEQCLKAKQQAILFLNRRGFAPYVFCSACGFVARCPHCAVTLTLHQRSSKLLCHYCGFTQQAFLQDCPECGEATIEVSGLGTERLESELRSLLGNALGIVRLDSDTINKRSDLETALGRFASRSAQILIGTQMVAKGHDFPGVTLVGVVSADAGLNFPDFRAAERTFQLLTQVGGRAGRGEEAGRVLVQAFALDHYALKTAAAHDYAGFVQEELKMRQELGYPPFKHLALLRYEGPDEGEVYQAAAAAQHKVARLTESLNLPLQILGPAAAPLTRLRGNWRVHILLKAQTRISLQQLLKAGLVVKTFNKRVKQIIDIDPYDML